MQNKIGYKVVIEGLRGVLCSPFAPESAAVVYPPGEWVEPLRGCGPLFCFAKMSQAASFAREISTYIGLELKKLKIYGCDYEPWATRLRRGRTICHNIEPSWGWSKTGDYLYLSDIRMSVVRDLMHGIRLCRRIRLLYEIPDWIKG